MAHGKQKWWLVAGGSGTVVSTLVSENVGVREWRLVESQSELLRAMILTLVWSQAAVGPLIKQEALLPHKSSAMRLSSNGTLAPNYTIYP